MIKTYEAHNYLGSYSGTAGTVYYYASVKAEMELTTGATKFYAGLFGRATQSWDGVEVALSPLVTSRCKYWRGIVSAGTTASTKTYSTYKGGNEYDLFYETTMGYTTTTFNISFTDVESYAYTFLKQKVYKFKANDSTISLTLVRDGTAPTGSASVTINRLGTVGSTVTSASQSAYGITDEYFCLSVNSKVIWEERWRSTVPISPYTKNVSTYLNSRFPNGSARNNPYKFVHRFTAGNGLSGENIVTGEIKSNLVSLSKRNRAYEVGDVVPLYDLFKAEGYNGYDITVDYGTYLDFTIKGSCPSGITYDSTTRKFTCNTAGTVTISIKVDESCDAYSEAEVTELNNISFIIVDSSVFPTFETPVYRFDTTLVLLLYTACKYLNPATSALINYDGCMTTYENTADVCGQLYTDIENAIIAYKGSTYYWNLISTHQLYDMYPSNTNNQWFKAVNGWITCLQGCLT